MSSFKEIYIHALDRLITQGVPYEEAGDRAYDDAKRHVYTLAERADLLRTEDRAAGPVRALVLAAALVIVGASAALAAGQPNVTTCTITFDPNTHRYYYSDCALPAGEYSPGNGASPH